MKCGWAAHRISSECWLCSVRTRMESTGQDKMNIIQMSSLKLLPSQHGCPDTLSSAYRFKITLTSDRNSYIRQNTFYVSLYHFFLLSPLAYKNKWVAFASQYLYCSWVCCKLMKWWSLLRNAVKALHLPDVRVALKVALRVKLHLGAGSSLLSVYKKYWMPF